MNTRRSVLGGMAALAAAPLAARAQGAPSWIEAPSLPDRAQEIYAATDGRRIWTAGGLQGRGRGPIHILDRLSQFESDAWTQPEPLRLPFPRHHPQLAWGGGRVWVLGGFRQTEAGQWSAVTDVLTADPDAPASGWRTEAPLPRPQSEAVTLVQGDRLHLIGGRSPIGDANARWTDQVDVADHRVLDLRTGRWTDARPAPTARNSAAAAVIEAHLYVVGGRTVDGGNLGTLERYDPVADRWDTLRPMPQASGGLAAAAMGGRLYAFGGEWFSDTGVGVYGETWVYDPARDAWTAGPRMRTPRHGLAAVTTTQGAAAGIYAIGGAITASAAGTSAVVERLGT